MKKILPIIIIVQTILAGCAASSALRFPPSRYIRDNDRTPIAEPKKRWRYSYAVGESERTQLASLEKAASFIGVPKMVTGGNEEALNTNNFDEAPDSTWFTNRLGRFDMAPSTVAKGANIGIAPSENESYKIVWVGRSDVTPELIVEDDGGIHYLLIFDTPEHAESATSATIIANRLLYALGYNVPESYIVNIDRSKLVLSPDAVTMTKYDEERAATSEDLDKLWDKILQDRRTGLVRTAMLKDQEGVPIGPFSFDGKRGNDKNDRIRHQYRRELRGLHTFCAFLNCTAMVEEQTTDFFTKTSGDKGYITHYIFRTDSTLGTYKESVEQSKYNPAKWNPFFPNAAFGMRTKRDSFWAAAILSTLSNNAIEATVNEAKYTNKKTRDETVRMLIDRRDKTVAYWLGKLSPLGNFELKDADGLLLKFDDLAGKNFYRYRLRTEKGRTTLKDWTETSDTNARIEDGLAGRILPKRLYVLELQAKKANDEWWLPPVDVFLKRTGQDEITLMGIVRRYR